MKKLLILFCILFIFKNMQAQNTCSSALELPATLDGVLPLQKQYNITKWYKFVATSADVELTVLSLPFKSVSNLKKGILYSGTCTSLTQIGNDTIVSFSDSIIQLSLTGLSIGNTYYFQIDKDVITDTLNYFLTLKNVMQACPTCPPAAITDNCNFVCNGNFEYYTGLPTGTGGYIAGYDPINLICSWQNCSNASPDYFNANVITAPTADVPVNRAGHQTSRPGGAAKGYAGFYAVSFTLPTPYHEYIYQRLRTPLVANTTYNISMYVTLADSSTLASNVGLKLSINNPLFTGMGIISGTPNYQSTIISDKTNWILVSFNYTAIGGEQYLTIGGFSNTNVAVTYPGGTPLSQGAYYYVDEVSIKVASFDVLASRTNVCVGDTLTLMTDTATNVTWSSIPNNITFSQNPSDTTIATSTAIGNTWIYGTYSPIANCVLKDSVQITVTGPTNCNIPFNYDIPDSTNASVAFGGLTIISNANIRINGVLFVNQNLSFSGCNVIMGANAKIIVQSAFGLSILNKSHLYSCCKMWEGIVVENGGSVRIETSSVIEDAKKAILVKQGATGIVDVVIFNKNHTGIEFTTNTGTPNFSITRTLFTCRDIPLSTTPSSNPNLNTIWANINSYSPTTCKYNSTSTIIEKSIYGINATDVAGLNIGVDNFANYQNAFDQLKCGINLTRTNVVIYNNIFQNLLSTSCFPCTNVYGFGIKAQGTATGNYSVTIGGPGTIYQPNSFSNCYRAMELNDYKTCTVKNNTITNSSTSTGINYGNTGLLIKPANGNILSVSNNVVTNCNNAVWINRSTTGNINSQEIIIENNTITSNASGFCTNGVNISDVSNSGSTTPVDKIKIQYNTITQAYNCVTATNVKNSLVIRSNTQLQVKNNGTAVNAIKLSGCKGVKIHDNQNINISPVYSPVNITPVGFKGIFVTGSTENQITCNKISNMGESMTFVGSCINSTLRNNTLDKGNRGFVLRTNGEVGAQGTPNPNGIPCGLWWSAVTTDFTAHTYTENTTTANNLSKLYVNSTNAPAGFTGIPTLNFTLNGAIYTNGSGINTVSASPISCGTIIIQMAPVGGGNTSMMSTTTNSNETTLLTVFATDESTYPVYEEEHQYNHKKYAFEKLDANGIITNSTLQNFYDSTQIETMGQLQQVDNALKLNDPALASVINNSLFANNLMENNQKAFNALYLNYLNNNEYVFTQTEKDELFAIAEQCPLEGGSSVWQARVLYSTIENDWIEFTDNCDATQKQMQVENNTTLDTQKENRFKLYPNPNNGEMTLEYILKENQTAVLSIYDVTGKSISSYSINNKNKSVKINENSLDAGVYFYQISVNDKLVKSDKLVIIK